MNAKKIAQQYRRGFRNREMPDLIHLIINVRSNRSIWVNMTIKEITGNKNIHRQYMIKSALIDRFGKDCFSCRFDRPIHCNKTWQKDGKFYSHDPEWQDGLPF